MATVSRKADYGSFAYPLWLPSGWGCQGWRRSRGRKFVRAGPGIQTQKWFAAFTSIQIHGSVVLDRFVRISPQPDFLMIAPAQGHKLRKMRFSEPPRKLLPSDLEHQGSCLVTTSSRVLVVEDSEHFRSFICSTLSSTLRGMGCKFTLTQRRIVPPVLWRQFESSEIVFILTFGPTVRKQSSILPQ